MVNALMEYFSRYKDGLRPLIAYLIAVISCLIILELVMNLWNADLKVPFVYGGDSIQAGMYIKGMMDNGWYLHNSFIGAPAGLDSHDFPMGSNLDFILIKVISFFTSDYASVTNIFFLLTFPLTTLTSMYVFRQFKISYLSSITGSLLFTFIPYHFLRGESHLFLASYYMVPLMVMVIIWLYSDTYLLFRTDKDTCKQRLDLWSHKSIISILICVLISSTIAYYVFFSCFFLLIAGMAASLSKKRPYPAITAIILLGVILGGAFINLLPTLIYQCSNGINPYAGVRSPVEAEVYGLKIAQLILPLEGHRISFLSNIMEKYNSVAPLVNENAFAALGIIGSTGFILLLGWQLYRATGAPVAIAKDYLKELDCLGILNVSAVLLATIGGLGSLIAVVFPQIRSYNRVSIYIAFFSLLAVFMAMELLSRRYLRTNVMKVAFSGLLILVLIAGIFDQTTARDIPRYDQIKAEYYNDDLFVKSIESVMPDNAMIFQLPYMQYPEYSEYCLPLYKIEDYDLLRGYLHSGDLRWSYGSMKGRYGDEWQKSVSGMPIDDMVMVLSSNGFNGIYVDSYGYPENDTTLISELSRVLDTTPIVSGNGRLYFFDMTGYNERSGGNYTQSEQELLRHMAFDPSIRNEVTSRPLFMEWRGGFSVLEGSIENNWRWCSHDGELYIINPSKQDIKVKMNMSVATGYDERSELFIDSDLFSQCLEVNVNGTFLEKEIMIPHGRHIIKFTSHEKSIDDADDMRARVFRISNFSMEYVNMT